MKTVVKRKVEDRVVGRVAPPSDLDPAPDPFPEPPEQLIADVEALRARCDSYVDEVVQWGRRQYPNQPPGVLRQLVIRGRNVFDAAIKPVKI